MRVAMIINILLIGGLLTVIACAPASMTPSAPASKTPSAPAPGIGPAAFNVSDLRIDPNVPEPGTTVRVGATVTNTGGQPGTLKVELKMQDTQTQKETAHSQDVTLAGGASQRVTFYITAHDGIHKVTIGNLTGTMEVPAS